MIAQRVSRSGGRAGLLAAALFAMALGAPAAAGGLSDLLMAPDVFAGAPAGVPLAYRETLAAPAAGSLAAGSGEIRVEIRDVDGKRELALLRVRDGQAVPVGTFAPGVANPVLLYFLETTVRAVAEATGGNPYYIRNRIREALTAADLGAGEGVREVTLVPFAADPNRARMGGFADLTLRIRFDPERPARILELSADGAPGPDGYHEALILIGEE